MVVVIPAYNPDYHLIDVINNLKDLKYKIVVVNDGSNKDCNKIFNKISKYAYIVNHNTNMGKGMAMKTGIKYIKDNLNEDGIIFVDADNQHDIEDIKNVINAFYNNPDSLILGCRLFNNKEVPIRSKIGNNITKKIFKLVTKTYISDTQTGLRCMNSKYIPMLLNIPGDRYEYEISMLKEFIKNKIDIKEVKIKTIYEDKKNSTSHFKTIKDSYIIYKALLKR